MIGVHPTTPGGAYGRYDLGTYANPSYTVSGQFLPKNFHDLLKWTRFIIVKSPTVTEVLRKLATYPITDVVVNSPNSKLRDKYEDIIESIRLIEKMSDSGFDYQAYGNSFNSIYFPIDRFLKCPYCETSYSANKALDGRYAIWKKWGFHGTCPSCNHQVTYERVDVASKDLSRINIVKWKPDNISINDNPITGDTEYYYNIPGDTKRKIITGDPHYICTLPWEFIEAVKVQKAFKFSRGQLYHMKSLSMGDIVEGFGVPPLLSHYSTVFNMECLKKANEAIALEHLNPMRILYPQQGTNAGDPASMMTMSNFSMNVRDALRKFKQDPNHILLSPVPVGVGNLGGQGKSLLVTQELKFAEEQLLMSMGVSRELLSGQTNWTSSTVGLRLLENNMNQYTRKLKRFLNWIMDQVTNYLGIEDVDVELIPFELTDNDQMKQLYLELHQRQLVSSDTLLNAFDIDPDKEREKIVQDIINKAGESIKTKHKVEIAEFMAMRDTTSDGEDDDGHKDYREEVMAIARKILEEKDEEKRNQMLIQLHTSDPNKYAHVMQYVQQYLQPDPEQPGDEEGASQ